MKKSQNIISMIIFKDFIFSFMFLLTAPIPKNIHALDGIYFIFLKRSWTKLKSFLTPNWDPSERIGKVFMKKDKI